MKQPTPGWDGYSPAGKQSWAFLRTAPFEHLIRGLLELQARPASCNRRPRPARTCSLPFRGARGPRPGVPRGEGTARLHRSASRPSEPRLPVRRVPTHRPSRERLPSAGRRPRQDVGCRLAWPELLAGGRGRRPGYRPEEQAEDAEHRHGPGRSRTSVGRAPPRKCSPPSWRASSVPRQRHGAHLGHESC